MQKKLTYYSILTISKLPFWFLYFIADILFVLIYYVFGYRKKVVFTNLRNSFPEKNETELKQIAVGFYKHFADLLVECIKLFSISADQAQKRLEMLNPEEIIRHYNNGKAVIGVTAHYGNWEYGIHSLSLMTNHPNLVIYKPLKNEVFNEIYNNARGRFGATMVPMKQILRHIVRLKNTPHMSIFVADQTPKFQDSDFYLSFLNQDTLVYTGPERIAKLTNNPVVFCKISRKPKRGHYSCKFITLVENPAEYEEHEITRIHNKFTEEIIKENPQYWLWSHNRWKRKRKIN